MKKKYILLAAALAITAACYSQTTIPLNDSTTIFKDQEGKVLSKEEVKELMKTKFFMKKDIVNDKNIITIIPTVNKELAKFQADIKAFKDKLIGKPVASFRLTDINNQQWNSKELKGKVIVINFWFTSCEPCIGEMPLLNEVVTANKYNPVVFLAPAPEKEAQIKKFLTRFKFDYNIIPSSSDYMNKLNIENFPTHLVIDKEGIVRQVFIGYSDDIKTKLQQEIDKVIQQ